MARMHCATIAVALLAAAVVPQTGAAADAAERYPRKPIRVIAPAAPGSGADIVSRLLGGKLTEAWGQQIVVDNRAGAAGTIGSALAARSVPDGYTLLMASSQQIIAPLTSAKPPFDMIRDFAPVLLIATTANVLSVNPSVPAATVKELLALARAQPGSLRYGSSGTGGTQHLAVEMLKTMAGVDFLHVPYKSTIFALTDVMAGHVQLAISPLSITLPLIRQGRLRPLGVTTIRRTPFAPDLPPIAETVPGYATLSWYGLVAPARTPEHIVGLLNAAINHALTTPEVREKLNALGVEPVGTTTREFAGFIADETAKARRTIAAAGLLSR